MNLGLEYETLCEEIRLVLSGIELEQYNKKVGYFQSKHPDKKDELNFVNELYAMVNEKHFYSEYKQEV